MVSYNFAMFRPDLRQNIYVAEGANFDYINTLNA